MHQVNQMRAPGQHNYRPLNPYQQNHNMTNRFPTQTKPLTASTSLPNVSKCVEVCPSSPTRENTVTTEVGIQKDLSSVETELNESSTKYNEDKSSADEKLTADILIESNLTHYLEIDVDKDELDMINTNEFLTNTMQLNEELVLANELLDLNLTRAAAVRIQNPTRTKYENLVMNEKCVYLNTSEKRMLKYFTTESQLFNDNQKSIVVNLNEESLKQFEYLLSCLSRSMALFHALFNSNQNNLNRLNTLIIDLIDAAHLNQSTSTTIQLDGWPLKIRQLKVGLKMSHLLLTKFDKCSALDLIAKGVQSKLIDLIELKSTTNDYLLSESMRLKCLACLNSSIQLKQGMEYFLEAHSNESEYSRLLSMFLAHKCSDSAVSTQLTPRLVIALTHLFSNVSFYECLHLFVSKCKGKFLQHQPQEANDFENSICDLFELIYIHCLRIVKLSKKPAELIVKNMKQKTINEDELAEKESEKSDNDESGQVIFYLFVYYEIMINGVLNKKKFNEFVKKKTYYFCIKRAKMCASGRK